MTECLLFNFWILLFSFCHLKPGLFLKIIVARTRSDKYQLKVLLDRYSDCNSCFLKKLSSSSNRYRIQLHDAEWEQSHERMFKEKITCSYVPLSILYVLFPFLFKYPLRKETSKSRPSFISHIFAFSTWRKWIITNS